MDVPETKRYCLLCFMYFLKKFSLLFRSYQFPNYGILPFLGFLISYYYGVVDPRHHTSISFTVELNKSLIWGRDDTLLVISQCQDAIRIGDWFFTVRFLSDRLD